MADSWSSFLTESNAQFDAAGLSRRRGGDRSVSAVDFGSNDYLGLRNHKMVLQAVEETLANGGWGSGASPVLGGHGSRHADLEDRLAALCGSESALVFTSGFACNAGTLACLAGEHDAVYSDQLNHASLIDGCRLSRARKMVYPHGDVDYLRNSLQSQRHGFGKVLVVTESIFSMDGDAGPLRELVELAQQYDCGLVVDEAHATGVYGQRGSGLLEEMDLDRSVFLKLGTLCKALGGVGGYACGPQDLVQFLVDRCRSYLFSTAPPAASMAGSLAAIELMQGMAEQRRTLRESALSLRQRLASQGWTVPEGDSPIVPVIVGSEQETLGLSKRLAERGFYVPAIRPPTVPAGTSRLRISLSATHSPLQMDRLVDAFGAVG